MRKTLLIITLGFAYTFAKAQDTSNLDSLQSTLKGIQKETYNDIRAAIVKLFLPNTDKKRYLQTPRDSAYLFSIALSFDPVGKVDTVYFSDKLPPSTKQILGLNDKLIDLIKHEDLSRFNHRNEIVLFPILFIQTLDLSIKIRPGTFLSDYLNLWPKFGSAIENKKLTLLDPYINRYGIAYQH